MRLESLRASVQCPANFSYEKPLRGIIIAIMPRRKAQPAPQIPAPQEAVAATPASIQPPPPSPAVLKLQDQVVELVAQRGEARKRLSEAHSAYLLAQGAFQAAEANVKSTEQDAQYLLGLIAQLENRQPMMTGVTANISGTNIVQMPGSLAGVTSEPASPMNVLQQGGNFALSPPINRREAMGMM